MGADDRPRWIVRQRNHEGLSQSGRTRTESLRYLQHTIIVVYSYKCLSAFEQTEGGNGQMLSQESTGLECMIREFIHPDLGREIRSISGYYLPLEEHVLEYNGREVVYVLGDACIEAS